MSARRSRRRSQPGAVARRSLRLQGQKDLAIGYERPTTSMDLKVATPRFLFKKVLQTQPVGSPLAPAKPRSSQPVESALQLSLRQSPSRSLQVSFRTPAPLEPAGKKGLLRRPRNYRSLNLKDFQEGIDENLQRAKESAQSDLLDSELNDTGKHSVSTKLFAQPQLSGRDEDEGASLVPSQNASAVLSFAGEGALPPEESPRWHLNTEADPVVSSTPVHHNKVQDIQPGSQFMLFNEKSDRRSVKKMVSHLIEELDKSISEDNREEDEEKEEEEEEELSPNGRAHQISPRTRVETPGSCVSRRNTTEPKSPPATQMEDGGMTQHEGNGSELQEMLDMQTEPGAETDPESEEMTDPETDLENVDPTGKTPAFVHARAFDCAPLLATPHTLEVDASRPSPRQGRAQRAPVPPRKARRTTDGSELPGHLIKKLFSHYAQMPVSKDAFKVVERSTNLYFKHLCDDLEVFTKHAGRKTTERADVELLMRRQGLITEKKPLNVLIEQHMPLEYRKLLIPVATSGNRVVPPKHK